MMLQNGWWKYLLAVLLGGLSALALPPFYFTPLLFVAFPVLLLLVEACRNKKQAFFTGWCFGFGHHLVGLYWISNSLLVEPEKFAWLIPFAVSLIPAAAAVYIGIVALVVFAAKLKGVRQIFFFAAVWTLAEMARGYLFTGFPWNLTGYVWTFSAEMIQVTSLFGIYGLSFLTILIISSFYLFFKNKFRSAILRVIAFICLLPLLFAFGAVRLANAVPDENKGATIRVVQGNIEQYYKWEPSLRFDSIIRHITLSQPDDGRNIDYIIWPETAVPYTLSEEPQMMSFISRSLPKGSALITGSLHSKRDGENFSLWNSVYLIDSGRGATGIYDKSRLVPFGEFIPFRKFLPFVQKITHGSMDFSAGNGAITLKSGNLPSFSPLICYEVIFPNAVIDKGARPDWLVNVTNDAWFGESSGPYQHFAMARVRAVEQGLPLVRAANTGISGIIDAYGRVKASLGIGKEGFLDSNLPPKLEKTIFYYTGNMLIVIICLLSLLADIIRRN